jgi:UDP-N-acetylmuramoyl-tripeptide--D-alanyl-D-alanine ligase
VIVHDAAGLAELAGGRLLPPSTSDQSQVLDLPPITGHVVIDSRQVGPGDVFVALPGEHVDGHDYVEQALAAGAAAALVQREPATAPAGPVVVVPDGVEALTRLATQSHARLRAEGLRTVGITGSAGKTTTKDLLASVLEHAGHGGRLVATRGSYNNELGLPLTVLRADGATGYLVLEMGARGAGHIAHLTRIARPDVAVVLGVGSAHLGEFGSKEAIARAKGELVEALDGDDPHAVAVLNGDDPAVRAMAGRTTARVVLFGEGEQNQVRALDVSLDPDARLVLDLLDARPGADQQTARVHLRLVGEQHLANALAAAAAALELGVPLADVAAGLSAAQPASRYRMEVVDRADGIRVVNDAYNASPEAVAAALRALAHMGRTARPPRRTWAVLGEMLELGEASRTEHDRIGRLAVRLNIDHLVVVGHGALHVHAGATHEGSWGEESVHVDDIDAARAHLAERLAPGDVVLVKASNSVGLWRLGDELAHPDEETTR